MTEHSEQRAKSYSWLRQKFEEFLNPASDGSKGSLFYLFVAALAVVIIVFGVAMIFSPETAGGTFGDFVGGTLNPILTFITFMALLITIVLQQTELRATKDELAKSATALENQIERLDRQNFEATFFQLLETLNNVRWSVHAMEGHKAHEGISAMNWLYSMMKTRYENNRPGMSVNKALYVAYESVLNSDGMVITSYHRLFDKVVEFVESSASDKSFYLGILQASLSEAEMLMLFYRTALSYGDAVRIPVQKYALLKGMPKRLLIEQAHNGLLPDSAFGVAPFDPNTALTEALPRDGA